MYVMAGVFRKQAWALGPSVIPAYLFHGVTAIVALILLFQAVGS